MPRRAPLPLLLAGLGALGGCQPPATPAVAFAAADIATIATLHRDSFDVLYSLISGRDCSIVRLDAGKSYCRPVLPPPAPPRFCTRTLGLPQCFADPATLADHPTPLADGPDRLTAAQERNRTAGWP